MDGIIKLILSDDEESILIGYNLLDNSHQFVKDTLIAKLYKDSPKNIRLHQKMNPVNNEIFIVKHGFLKRKLVITNFSSRNNDDFPEWCNFILNSFYDNDT